MITQEAVQFYADKHLQVEKLISKRRPGLTKEQVLDAAQKVYDAIQAGEKIKDISIAHRVWALAKTFRTTQVDASQGAVTTNNVVVEQLKKLLDEERVRNEKRETMIWRAMWLAFVTTTISAMTTGVLFWRFLT